VNISVLADSKGAEIPDLKNGAPEKTKEIEKTLRSGAFVRSPQALGIFSQALKPEATHVMAVIARFPAEERVNKSIVWLPALERVKNSVSEFCERSAGERRSVSIIWLRAGESQTKRSQRSHGAGPEVPIVGSALHSTRRRPARPAAAGRRRGQTQATGKQLRGLRLAPASSCRRAERARVEWESPRREYLRGVFVPPGRRVA